MARITSREQDEKTQLYRRVFNTKDGREVLEDMLLELNFFDGDINPKDEQRITKRNFGAFLLYNTGVLVDKNVKTIIDNMMDMEYISDISVE